MGLALLVFLGLVVWFRYGTGGKYRPLVDGALGSAFLVGGVCFAAGFFGPMILAPGANQGPLLGILITGPLGFLAGLAWGIWRAVRQWRSG